VLLQKLPMSLRAVAALALPLALLGQPGAARPGFVASHHDAVSDVVSSLRHAACTAPALARLSERGPERPCAEPRADAPAAGVVQPAVGAARLRLAPAQAANGDGTLIDRQRLLTIGPVALDLVAYLSSGLIVGGLLCYPDDGEPHTTVLHLHGGLGGIFIDPDGGDIVGTCYSWAADHGRTSFVPSFRGQDGGQGEPELCLGEADDVVAAALLVRSLEVTDPDRVALVGGSMGGCVALRAGARIPDLRAVVAIAPPTDWKAMTEYHRNDFVPAVETRCDGSTLDWDTGGPEFADTLDDLICGHPVCSEAEYNARSPFAEIADVTNPTLVLVPGADNLVPVEQQVLWAALRNLYTGEVAVDVRDRCDPPAAPPLVQDALLFVPGGYHLLESGNVVSGLVWLTGLLDAADPPAGEAL